MKHSAAKRLVCSLVCVLGLLLIGCGESSNAPSYGEWTLTDSLQLTETLRVSETEEYYFGSIFALDVTSRGRIAVADQGANNVKLLRPDGTLIDTLGREGQGPGEFQLLVDVSVARGDSLYAVGALQNRVVVFSPSPSHDIARTMHYEGSSRIWFLDRGRLTREGENGTETSHTYICREAAQKAERDTLLHVPTQETRRVSLEGGAQRIVPVPFTPRPEFAVDSDRLYYGRTDRLQVEAYAIDGSSEQVVSVPTPSIPVRASDRDSTLRNIENRALREKVAPAIPDVKPAFMDLLVADDGRLWVQRPSRQAGSETVPWWILEPDTKTIHEVRLPRAVELEVVKGGKAYGITTTRMGGPAVVRYRIEREF